MRLALVTKHICNSFFADFFREFATEVSRSEIEVAILAGIEGSKEEANPFGSGGTEEVHVPYPPVVLRMGAGSATWIASNSDRFLDERMMSG